MEIMETKLKLTKEGGGWQTANVEALSVFQNARNMERQGPRGKPAQITLVLPDDWVEEIVLHAVGSRKAEHNFLLLKIPMKDEKEKVVKKKAKAAKKITSRKKKKVTR
jgi:hypothetical protein